jgi:predicted RNase H-like nuclease
MGMSGPRRGRGANLPYRPLAGVVPCPGGWLAATAKLQGITIAAEDPTVFTSFLEVLDYKPAFQVIAVFAAVGLPDEPAPGGRKCDRDARKLLRWPRSGAIASPPARSALQSKTYQDAIAANGGHLSPIGWHLVPRLAEIDGDIAPYWQRTVFEVHAELSFYQLNEDRPLRFSKHTESGRDERRTLLKARFPGVERILDARIARVTAAHLLDAAACLWTSRRITARAVSRIPEDPEWDSQGLRMEMVR